MSNRFTPYQRRLLAFLGVANFFEGYDHYAFAMVLPNLRADMGLGETGGGFLSAFINLGTVIAYLFVRRADGWGRKRVLTVTILGYTLFTVLSGLSPDVYSFALFQMIGRIFLIGEWATSMVVAAEEFSAERRGTAMGVVVAMSSLGSVVCGGVAPLLLNTAYGWRSVYFVGIVPLLLIAYARRGLKETERFAASTAEQRAHSLFDIWRTPYRGRVMKLGLIWFLSYLCTNNAVVFWKEFALAERSMTDAQVGAVITIAAVVAMPLVFFAGHLLDRVGRRRGALVIFGLTSLGVFGGYTLHGQWPLTVAVALSIFGVSAVLPVLNAFTTELFPTEHRGAAFAWSNNLLGRIGYVLSPAALGALASEWGWGNAIRLTAIFPILAVILIWVWMPETNARELEQTATLER
ncbi:MAG: MFS transporter [Polyangiaceae bacterium]|nr:MFS transporter [Polyangiaceae bacterium]